MCIKAGENELESVKALMSMSLKAIVADALDADIDAIEDDTRLVEDLHMDADKEKALGLLIAEYFDDLEIRLDTAPTFGALLDKVVLSEFRDLTEYHELAA